MALHLLKLCVGPATVEELETRNARNHADALQHGHDPTPFHTTRMVPKRADEIAGKGSLYWVIKGMVVGRQAIRSIEPFTASDGIARCRLMLDPAVRRVVPRPCRPFQGWRYLSERDAPAELDRRTASGLADMPDALRRELSVLGLL